MLLLSEVLLSDSDTLSYQKVPASTLPWYLSDCYFYQRTRAVVMSLLLSEPWRSLRCSKVGHGFSLVQRIFSWRSMLEVVFRLEVVCQESVDIFGSARSETKLHAWFPHIPSFSLALLLFNLPVLLNPFLPLNTSPLKITEESTAAPHRGMRMWEEKDVFEETLLINIQQPIAPQFFILFCPRWQLWGEVSTGLNFQNFVNLFNCLSPVMWEKVDA